MLIRNLALLLLLSIALSLDGAPPRAKRAEETPHPAVDTAESCDRCHAELTAETHRLWYESRHGMLGVTCVVCHGSVGSGFRRKPTAERCAGCHGAKADSMKGAFFAGKSCFTCHQPHSLNPHAGGAK